jgi:hypothetical protein
MLRGLLSLRLCKEKVFLRNGLRKKRQETMTRFVYSTPWSLVISQTSDENSHSD